MANILKENITINFEDKVWSTDSLLDSYPWAMVGVESTAVFNATTGGVDTYSNLTKENFNSHDNYSQAITVGDMKNHIIHEDGTIERVAGEGITGKLTINGGNYMAPSSVVYVCKGDCIINGGLFFGQPDPNQRTQSEKEAEKYPYGRNFLLNLYDKNRTAGTAHIYVTGGTFVGFDPADNYAEGNDTNFVCVGYKSVLDGEYTYMVKDLSSPDNGTLRTVPVYTVVPVDDEREGIAGTQTVPNE
jgi:hypothetical protein